MEKLLLALVSATVVLARPPAPTSAEANPLELIMAAVDLYNGEFHSDVLFRLYKDEYDYKEGAMGEKQANFTIKETVCQKSKNETLGRCEFNLRGLEKSCTAAQDAQGATLSVLCLPVAAETKPGNGDDNTEQPEEEASYEDRVIIMDESDKTFVEKEEKEEKRDQDVFLAPKPKNTGDDHLISRITKKEPQAGLILGRLLCLQCFFDTFSRK
ncbi:uncharacterized protein [Phyllobates terribilis]